MHELTRTQSLHLAEAGNDLLVALNNFQAALDKTMQTLTMPEGPLPECTQSALSQHLVRLRDIRPAPPGVDVPTYFQGIAHKRLGEVLAVLDELMRHAEPIRVAAANSDMPNEPTSLSEFAHSSNGDSWLLGRDTETGEQFVIHRANPASGSQETKTPIGAFLAVEPLASERVTLAALLSNGNEKN